MVGHAGFGGTVHEGDLEIVGVLAGGHGRLYRGVGLPIIEELHEGERRVGGGRVAGLRLLVDAVTTGAGADFAGRKGQPIAFPHDAGAVGVGELPGHRPSGGYEGRLRAVGGQRHAANRCARQRRIVHRRVVDVLGDDAPAVTRVSRMAVIESAQLVGLKKLQPGDVIDFARRADGLMGRAGNVQVERLLMVRLVARGHVAADDQGELMRAQIIPECPHVHTCCGECGQFRRSHRHGKGGWARSGHDFDGVEFPKRAGDLVGDVTVRVEVTGLVGQSRGKQCGRRIIAVAGLQEFQPEIVGGERIVRAVGDLAAGAGLRQFIAGVRGNQPAVRGHERIAIQPGVVGRNGVGVGGVFMGGARREVIDAHKRVSS